MKNWIHFNWFHPFKRGFRVLIKNQAGKPLKLSKKMMEFPSDLKYTVEHEWIRLHGNEATVGITDFAQRELGDIVFIEIPDTSDLIEKGAVFGSVEAVKTVSDLFMPVTGKILEINAALKEKPELLNTDPYGAGWLIKLLVEKENELGELLPAAEYQSLVS